MRRKSGAILPIERAILDAGVFLHGNGTAEFHGFMLAKEMQALADARRLTSHGTLYKALDRIENAGLIESRWEAPTIAARENRPRRRLYHVTAKGQTVLAHLEPVVMPNIRALREGLSTG